MAIKRVDEALVERALADSIAHARLLVLEGKVYQGGGKVEKASDRLKPALQLDVRDAKAKFVSRGGLKLERALEVFGIDVRDKVCLDVGASTGGFTDALLKAGARMVYAVDVGFGLLDWSLRRDPRVVVMEKTNARALTPEMFDIRPSLGATDVSFISLKAVLPPALHVLVGNGRAPGEDRRFVALVKPQFEAAREDVSAGGVVRDPAVHAKVLESIIDFAATLGWQAAGLDCSPVTGAEGNIEFLLDLVPARGLERPDVPGAVERAWTMHPQKKP
ncbi:TlyA family RNA methyltransferase [Bacillota bacterium Meth-B3]